MEGEALAHGEALSESKIPEGQRWPLGQVVQLAAPAKEYVPAGQSVAFMELKRQKEPAGQMTGAPEEQ